MQVPSWGPSRGYLKLCTEGRVVVQLLSIGKKNPTLLSQSLGVKEAEVTYLSSKIYSLPTKTMQFPKGR